MPRVREIEQIGTNMGIVTDEVENTRPGRAAVVMEQQSSGYPEPGMEDLKAQMPGDRETTWDMLVDQWKCKDCEEEAKKILAEDCMECEDGIKE